MSHRRTSRGLYRCKHASFELNWPENCPRKDNEIGKTEHDNPDINHGAARSLSQWTKVVIKANGPSSASCVCPRFLVYICPPQIFTIWAQRSSTEQVFIPSQDGNNLRSMSLPQDLDEVATKGGRRPCARHTEFLAPLAHWTRLQWQ